MDGSKGRWAQARNVMRQMKKGNQVLFYRSGTKDPGALSVSPVLRPVPRLAARALRRVRQAMPLHNSAHC